VAKTTTRPRPIRASERKHDARPDTLDFRDRMYVPTLVEVPEEIPLTEYQAHKIPILDQGKEGACTGFGLATVANYLLWTRKVVPRTQPVSPRMLYEMAKRYDEWPGERYEGSSARGAMKGWHKHGVCSEKLWPYDPKKQDRLLTDARARDASQHQLGAYFRVNHRDLVAMHTALAEVGVLFATSDVHAGWDEVGEDGEIPYAPGKYGLIGGHAFAIVAFDREGFWIQNSWSGAWGKDGFAHLGYDDWLVHGNDVWVARLGVAVSLASAGASASTRAAAAGSRDSYSQADLRPHIVSIGNEGKLRDTGAFGTSRDEVAEIIGSDLPRITKSWKKKRILLYAHGGLVSEAGAIQRVADYRSALLAAEVYPLSFIWKSDFWTTITNILKDAFARRRSEGFLDATKDFMLDRLDDALEPLARLLTGKAVWSEMKENAIYATTKEGGGARFVATELAKLIAKDPSYEIHVVGHSAGSIFHAPLVQYLATQGKVAGGEAKGLAGLGLSIQTCTLWAPACTTELFHSCYLPLLSSGRIKQFTLFTLTDKAERDDNCARIYNKSLLYLVSNALEKRFRIPLLHDDGEPILGMQTFVKDDKKIAPLFAGGQHAWVRAPNTGEPGSPDASTSREHGAFDDDDATVRATLARILGGKLPAGSAPIVFPISGSALQNRRDAACRQ
jgi:hypothetical protein